MAEAQPSVRLRHPASGYVHTGGMENRESVSTDQLTVSQWTKKLAKSTGMPGGGAGSGVMVSMAAALISMTAGYSQDAGDGSEAGRIGHRAELLRRQALRLADEDAACSKAFGEAFHAPRGPARSATICEAALAAARSSAAIGRQAATAVGDLAWLAEHGNPALVADVVVALGALRASISGCRANVRYDLSVLREHRVSPSIGDGAERLSADVECWNRAVAQIDGLSAAIDQQITDPLTGG